ncbi:MULTISPECIES: Gfo/Idh/MocA family oxidoreductase [Microbacterium]|uniref:Gfo/Idh/MocA family protein n=1 Tax=Microbacterium TaxID=33882 RepID=UPI00146A3162|nr:MULTISPECIES: Gfo/Idh/MocA family oxidoreductase [Microbacterium]
MRQALRWGIIGTGSVARSMTRDLLGFGHSVVSVGSRNRPRADEFATSFGIPRAHGSYEDLVNDPTVDIVYVGTPHVAHASNALLALDAGKHVLVEKPFTITAEEARLVTNRAREKGLVVLDAMWTRFLPHMVRIRQIIEDGTLGEIHTLIADHGQRLPLEPPHRFNQPSLGGGAILELGIYPVAFASQLFGPPARTLATSSPTPEGVDRQTSVIFQYPGGKQSLIQTAIDAQGPNTAVVVGTEARIEVESVWYSPTSFVVRDPAGKVLERFEEEVPHRGMQFEAAALEDQIARGILESPVMPPAESVEIMAALDEVRRQIGLHFPFER